MLMGDFSKIYDREVKKVVQGDEWAIIYFADGTKANIGVR